VERRARLLRSPGLARALVTAPSLLLPWLISTVVAFGVGALVSPGPGQPLVWLIALGAAVTNVHVYLPHLAVAACCAVVVGYATRPQREF
jgi:hypothetical protein